MKPGVQVVVKLGHEEACTKPIKYRLASNSGLAINQTLQLTLADDRWRNTSEMIEVYVNRGKANVVRALAELSSHATALYLYMLSSKRSLLLIV